MADRGERERVTLGESERVTEEESERLTMGESERAKENPRTNNVNETNDGLRS